jgi:hypothetical protein
MPTAIIVTNRGEVFTHWASASRYSPSGSEECYLIPEFGIPKKVTLESNDLHPFGTNVGDTYWINEPHQYESEKSALKALKRMELLTSRRLAIVC